jgi:hypothetical protein
LTNTEVTGSLRTKKRKERLLLAKQKQEEDLDRKE